ncbi:MAG: hypothetical protein ACJAVK_002875 [Akkermansiaceae bacterium]|jgi:hypothetical protein
MIRNRDIPSVLGKGQILSTTKGGMELGFAPNSGISQAGFHQGYISESFREPPMFGARVLGHFR